jgi:Domain of unknown function (DUF3387)/HD domain
VSEPTSQPGVGEPVRLADLLTGLTLTSDLAMGEASGDSLRTALLATELARAIDLPEPVVADVYYTALLQHVGCTAPAHELAALFDGDERTVHVAAHRTDFADGWQVLTTFLPELIRGASPLRRIKLVTSTVFFGGRVDALRRANCEVAAMMADRLGLGPHVQEALQHAFEWWNGKGDQRIGGDDIALPMRLAQVAAVAVIFHGTAGTEAAVEAVRRRAGAMLDPGLADVFARLAPGLLSAAGSGDVVEVLPAAEPEPVRTLSRSGLVEAVRAFGEVVELKSPYLHGHSAAVTGIAVAAGTALGLGEAADGRLRLAALLHDVGRAAVPSGLWDKPAKLTAAEWEHVRLHPYHTERILRRTPVLAPIATIASMHHERCDGSGYHRALIEEHEIVCAILNGHPWRDAVARDGDRAYLRAVAGTVDWLLGHHPGPAESPCTTDTPCLKCRFMAHTRRVIALFTMCVPADEALALREDVAFFEAVRASISKIEGVDRKASIRTPNSTPQSSRSSQNTSPVPGCSTSTPRQESNVPTCR